MQVKQILVLSVLFAFISQFNCQVMPHNGTISFDVPQTYKVQWNVEPRQRWLELAKIYKEPIQAVVNAITSILPIPQSLLDYIENYADTQYKYQEYVQEIHGIADGAEAPFSLIFLANFAYEFSTACTGAIVRNKYNVIMHGRNLDFPGAQLLSKLSAKVEIYKDAEYVATFDQLVGYVFCLTGQRVGKFAINVDTRMEFLEFYGVLKNIFINQYLPSAALVREVLLNQTITNFTQANESLSTTQVTGPIYYIISGISGNQGTVIEKDPNRVHASYSLNDKTWFIVQTNYDRNKPDKDGRRTAAEQRISAIGPEITMDQLFNDVMLQFPTFNSITLYTASMINALTYNNLTAWYGINTPNVSKTHQIDLEPQSKSEINNLYKQFLG